MSNEQPSLDQTGTWEPDWDDLCAQFGSWFYPGDNPLGDLKAIFSELQREQAAQGIVEVKQEDLAEAVDRLRAYWRWLSTWVPDWRANECMEFVDRLDSYLAAAKEQS